MHPALFQPIQLGNITLAHRVALSPVTRFRSDSSGVHSSGHGLTYYTQRSSPGGLLITEATLVHPRGGGRTHMPGITTEAQISAWKKIVDSVHAKGGYIFMQIGAIGRQADPAVLSSIDPSWDVIAASPYPNLHIGNTPREITIPEIKQFVSFYAQAAHNAVHLAGFDGVEIHGGNGWLIDTFLKKVSNWRTDEYGGSAEARCRLALEVIEAVVKAVGEKKTAFRISPFFTSFQMAEKDPVPTYTHLISEIRTLYPNLAYLHSTEPYTVSPTGISSSLPHDIGNDFIRELWGPRPFVIDGGFKQDTALSNAEKHAWDVVAFGRFFIANPDLPYRIEKSISFNQYDRSTFYTPESPVGYIDYPFADEL